MTDDKFEWANIDEVRVISSVEQSQTTDDLDTEYELHAVDIIVIERESE